MTPARSDTRSTIRYEPGQRATDTAPTPRDDDYLVGYLHKYVGPTIRLLPRLITGSPTPDRDRDRETRRKYCPETGALRPIPTQVPHPGRRTCYVISAFVPLKAKHVTEYPRHDEGTD
jgi:hypothetical protein